MGALIALAFAGLAVGFAHGVWRALGIAVLGLALGVVLVALVGPLRALARRCSTPKLFGPLYVVLLFAGLVVGVGLSGRLTGDYHAALGWLFGYAAGFIGADGLLRTVRRAGAKL